MGAIVFQVGISGPLVLALILYTAARRDRGLVHRYLLALLVLIVSWMGGMVLSAAEAPGTGFLADLLLFAPAALMSPVFCLTMLLYARIELVEQRREARWALLAPFWLFLLAFLTDPWHGQMAGARANLVPSSHPVDASPLFWSFQICSNVAATVGLGVCVWLAATSRVADERRRMVLLCAGALVPLVAHVSFMLRVVPGDVMLTPSALGVSALLIVRAIQRYRLLEVQPLARRDVIEASSDAVILADAEQRVIDLNPAAIALLAGERARLCSASLSEVLEVLGRTEPEGALHALLEAARTGGTPPLAELETSDGRILEANVGRPRIDAVGASGYFLVLRDRTQERRAERLLQQTQKLESVGILAAGVAHEVNNPLSFVRANLSYLQQIAGELEGRADELPKDLSEQAHDLADVVEETITGLDRIQKIVQALLRLSRTSPERREACDPNAVVAEAARFASPERDSAIRLELRLAEHVPGIHASPDQLVQVLLNLILNARHALRDRPDAAIVVSTSVREGFVEIRVSDNGPGVPEAIRDKIFDPFFTTRPPNEGTGLGLPIAFDIVREHQGALALEESPTGGACFVVRLPVHDDSDA